MDAIDYIDSFLWLEEASILKSTPKYSYRYLRDLECILNNFLLKRFQSSHTLKDRFGHQGLNLWFLFGKYRLQIQTLNYQLN